MPDQVNKKKSIAQVLHSYPQALLKNTTIFW